MNESTLTQLKILVERVVRPVRASTGRKRKMREELLAHVSGVFEEEVATLGDERAALERTANRFGDHAELTSQLQLTVPASDWTERFVEWAWFRPAESTLRRATRQSLVFETHFVLFFALPIWLALRGQISEWPAELVWYSCSILLAQLLFLVGHTFLAEGMRHALYERPFVEEGRTHRRRVYFAHRGYRGSRAGVEASG